MVFDGGVGRRTAWSAGRLRGLVAALAGMAILAGSAGAATAQQSARSVRQAVAHPVVVELYTAQGCASCPSANKMLDALAEDTGVVALTFSVDYWDYLGWSDTFAKPEFTARQRAYVSRLRLKEIYTPEVVVQGRREAPGVDQDKIEQLVAAERARKPAPHSAPTISVLRHGRRVTLGAGTAPARAADVWLIRYDPMRRDVKVKAGENAGKTVTHYNVVRDLTRLGAWTGTRRSFSLPASEIPGLKALVVIQAPAGGPILAASRG